MIVDIIILIIMAGCVLWGAKKGFVRAFMSVVSFIIAIAAAVLCFDWFSALLTNSFVGKTIGGWIGSGLENAASDAMEAVQLPKIFGAVSLNAPIAELTQKLTGLIVSILAIVLLILIIKLVLRLLVALLDSVARVPVLKQCNGLMGGVFGLLAGAVWVTLLVSVISALSFLPGVNYVNGWIASSYLLKTFYNYNFLLSLLPGV